MDLCNELCLSGRAPWRGKHFNVRHYTVPFQPVCFIPAMLIGTIDFYHFISLSLVLT